MGLCPFLPYFLKVPLRAEGPNGVRDRLVYESSTGHFYFEFLYVRNADIETCMCLRHMQ